MDIVIYPLLTYISKLSCFVLCLDMGQGSVYQVLGFVVVISEDYIPIVTLVRCLWEMVSSIWFLVLLFFYSVLGSPQMFVW